MKSPPEATRERKLRPILLATLVFLVAAVAAATLTWRLEQHRLRDERARVFHLAGDHTSALQRQLDQAFSATYALAALVREGHGAISDFDDVASQMLPLYPGVSALQLAPGGIVQAVVPLAGNEAAIGLDTLGDPAQAKEARLARDTGKLTLAGPFELVQGGVGAVARLPVFLDDEQGRPAFWGFTTVLISFPHVLDGALLSQLVERGFGYELWHTHPESGEKQIIAASSSAPLIGAVEHPIQVPNGTWTLSVAPVKGWGDPLGLFLKGALGLAFSLLLAWPAKLLAQAKAHEVSLEALVAERTAKIREGEERLRRLEDNLPDSYVYQYLRGADGHPRFLYLSAGVEGLHGLSKEDALNEAGMLLRQIDPEHLPTLEAAAAASLQNLTDLKMQLRICRTDGEWRWLKVRSRPRRIAADEVLWDGVVTDITGRKRAEEALRRSESDLRKAQEIAKLGSWNYDLADGTLSWSEEMFRMFGVSPETFMPNIESLIHLIHSEDRSAMLAWIAACEAGEKPGELEFRAVLPDGTVRVISGRGELVHSADGRPAHLSGTANDITERRLAEEGLHLARFCIDHAAIGIFRIEEDGRIVEVNDQACSSLGYSREELCTRTVFDIDPDLTREWWFEHRLGLMSYKGSKTIETAHRRKDSSIYPVEVTINYLEYAGRPLAYSFVTDITERKYHEEQLRHLATHDELTGLANRTLLLDRLEQTMHYARRSGRLVAVLLLDLDRFKVVNDSLGHAFGDMLLCSVAQRLNQSVREADTVARLGGDEFVILLAEVAEVEDAGLVAAKILRLLAEPHRLDDREITLTASLGVSLFPRDSDDGPTLIRNADTAMYRAKRNESSTFVFYSPEMNQRIRETLELEGALRQALEREEFCLHYQPKVDLASGRVIGCEALVRWHHPQRGMVSPADFIPLAEETGLIVPLGTWVLKEACRQAKAWQTEGLPSPSVAVNLSSRQFRTGNLPQLVQEILQDAHLDPGLLELELTESMVMDDPAAAERIMFSLKDLGVKLSLDDFGTGYSSLNYLRRFPVDSLKIDRSFIRDVATDPSGASVVTSVIDIAHNLGLTAVAEGVETREQLAFLIGCGCDILQGYLFSKPLPPEEFTNLLREGRQLAVG